MPDNDLQKLSPAYRLPGSDPEFILSDSMQGVRFLLEFAKADERLRSWGVRTTIVVLGSARIREANGDARGVPAASMARWYDEARRFGRIVSERGGALASIDGQRDNALRRAAVLGSWRRPTAAPATSARRRSDSISNCRASRSQIPIRHPSSPSNSTPSPC